MSGSFLMSFCQDTFAHPIEVVIADRIADFARFVGRKHIQSHKARAGSFDRGLKIDEVPLDILREEFEMIFDR